MFTRTGKSGDQCLVIKSRDNLKSRDPIPPHWVSSSSQPTYLVRSNNSKGSSPEWFFWREMVASRRLHDHGLSAGLIPPLITTVGRSVCSVRVPNVAMQACTAASERETRLHTVELGTSGGGAVIEF